MWGNGAAFDNTVYPHACGERLFNVCGWKVYSGLSPRLWGTDLAVLHAGSGLRFIPTPVGNGLPFSIKRINSSVYPHACGERVLTL